MPPGFTGGITLDLSGGSGYQPGYSSTSSYYSNSATVTVEDEAPLEYVANVNVGAGVWWVNREFGSGGQAKKGWFSHSFALSTNSNGTLLNTYSYGNNGASLWVMNAGPDVAAAQMALSNPQMLNFIGGADYIPDLDTAFRILAGISSDYNIGSNNCKQNLNTLINLMIYLHYNP